MEWIIFYTVNEQQVESTESNNLISSINELIQKYGIVLRIVSVYKYQHLCNDYEEYIEDNE